MRLDKKIKKSLNFKLTIGLAIIYLISAIILNCLMRYIFNNNIENTIKKEAESIQISSKEYIKDYLFFKNANYDKKEFINNSFNMANNLSSKFSYHVEILDENGEVIEKSVYDNISGFKGNINEAIDGKSILNIKNSHGVILATLTYPIYLNDQLIGIINISKDYSEVYKESNKLLNMLTVVEILIFIILSIVSYLFIFKTTKPLSKLTKAVKQLGVDNYDIEINYSGEDEISVLTKEFLKMKDRIKEQFNKINEEKEKVETLNKSRTDFFNNVTHELKTPLTAIIGYTQLLKGNEIKNNESKERALSRIQSESERLHQMVIELIEVSKGLSSIQDEKEPLDIKEILLETCDVMSIKGEKYGVKIETKLKDVFINGNKDKMKQVFINLLDNGIKYSNVNSNIEISCEEKNKEIIIKFINEGEKISKEIMESIFEPFVKGNNSSEKGSRGLGLYICKEIIDIHKGNINVENREKIIVTIKIPSLRNTLETSGFKIEKTT
ncbi:MAG: ATP-binding protein [Clostridiaceae bacterium]